MYFIVRQLFPPYPKQIMSQKGERRIMLLVTKHITITSKAKNNDTKIQVQD